MNRNVKPKLESTLRGIFAPSIQYETRNVKGDWSPYFGEYEGQKKDWWDTNSCWAYAGNEVLEDQLEFLEKTGRFSYADLKWFNDNGYIDEDGDFYLSRRFITTISGVQDGGNDEAEFWRLTKKYGAIPSKLLPFTTKEEYFDDLKITAELLALGKEFLKRVSIQYKECGRRFSAKAPELLETALFQSELQIGIPVPNDTNEWNKTKVKWDGGKQAVHSVALYKYDPVTDLKYPYFIYDQYEPHLKQLSRDYFIPIATWAVVNPMVPITSNPISQLTLGAQIWKAIYEFFVGK